MFKLFPMCSNASSKMWTPLFDCFVNELLIFANRPLAPAVMLSFDVAVCDNLLRQFL